MEERKVCDAATNRTKITSGILAMIMAITLISEAGIVPKLPWSRGASWNGRMYAAIT